MAEKKKIINNFFEDENFKLLVRADAVSHIDSDGDYKKTFHEEIEIKLFYEGSATLVVGNETVVANPGDVVIMNPYEFHSTVKYGEEIGKYHILMVGLDFFENIKDAPDLRHIFLGEKNALVTHITDNARLARILNDIVFEYTEKKQMYVQAINGLMLELFALLLRDYKSEKTAELPSDKHMRYYEIIYPAIQKIRTDFAGRVSIDEFAEMCSISKYHFCRIFKAVTGISVLQYQTEYRLQIADALLKNTTKTVSEIAEICGFDDICYFSRCYKKHTGMSPKQKRAILSK